MVKVGWAMVFGRLGALNVFSVFDRFIVYWDIPPSLVKEEL